MGVIHRREDCRVCGGTQLDLVFQLAPSPIGDAYVMPGDLSRSQPSYPLDWFLCRRCGLVQLLDVIDPSVLYGHYLYTTGSSLGLSEHFDAYARSVTVRCNLAPGSLVVDIGSNDGMLLQAFQDRGMKVLGVEPAPVEASVPTYREYFTPDLAERIVAAHGQAQLITANNVLANVDDLLSFVTAVEILLAPNGVFVFESFYLPDLLVNTVFDFLYHEHLSAFAVHPIQLLVDRVGLGLVAVEHVDTKGGSLRYFVQRLNGPVKWDGSVFDTWLAEDDVGIHRRSTYERFAGRVDALKQETCFALVAAKRRRKSIVGYGASVSCTTLLYHFGLGEYLDYLVDDNPAKVGRYSPGLHLPVLPSSVLEERQPETLVILAWRYAKPIRAKHPDYRGRVIIPVGRVPYALVWHGPCGFCGGSHTVDACPVVDG